MGVKLEQESAIKTKIRVSAIFGLGSLLIAGLALVGIKNIDNILSSISSCSKLSEEECRLSEEC